MMICWTIAEQCINPDAIYTCYQCGRCGRVFVDGVMVDDGGTTPYEGE